MPLTPTMSYLSGIPNLYSISYDLRATGQNYSALISEIERMGGFRFQQSTWLVTSYASNSAELRDRLLMLIDSNDSLFVTRIVEVAGFEGIPQIRAWIETYLRAAALN